MSLEIESLSNVFRPIKATTEAVTLLWHRCDQGVAFAMYRENVYPCVQPMAHLWQSCGGVYIDDAPLEIAENQIDSIPFDLC